MTVLARSCFFPASHKIHRNGALAHPDPQCLSAPHFTAQVAHESTGISFIGLRPSLHQFEQCGIQRAGTPKFALLKPGVSHRPQQMIQLHAAALPATKQPGTPGRLGGTREEKWGPEVGGRAGETGQMACRSLGLNVYTTAYTRYVRITSIRCSRRLRENSPGAVALRHLDNPWVAWGNSPVAWICSEVQ